MGRWIYLDGMRNGVWTAHSLALALFFGPTGILSHLLTRGVVRVFRWWVWLEMWGHVSKRGRASLPLIAFQPIHVTLRQGRGGHHDRRHS